MGKNRDLVQILILVVIGMFIPFLGSIIVSFELDITNIDNWLNIGKTFGYFLIIFALELGVVFFYYTVTDKIANKKIQNQKHK